MTGRDGLIQLVVGPDQLRRAIRTGLGGPSSLEFRARNPINSMLQELGDPALRVIVALTLRVTGSALLIATVIGVPVGALVGLARFPGRRFIALLLYTGMGLPPVVVGLFVYLLLSHGGPMGDLGWLFTPAAMVVAQTVIAFPLVAALTMSAVESVDADLRLQIRALGATRWQLGWTVVRDAPEWRDRRRGGGVWRHHLRGWRRDAGRRHHRGQTSLTTAIVLYARQGEFAVALALGLVLIGLALTANVVLPACRAGTDDARQPTADLHAAPAAPSVRESSRARDSSARHPSRRDAGHCGT